MSDVNKYRVSASTPTQVELPEAIRSKPGRDSIWLRTSGGTLYLSDAELSLVKAVPGAKVKLVAPPTKVEGKFKPERKFIESQASKDAKAKAKAKAKHADKAKAKAESKAKAAAKTSSKAKSSAGAGPSGNTAASDE